jgi:hypothetical protein
MNFQNYIPVLRKKYIPADELIPDEFWFGFCLYCKHPLPVDFGGSIARERDICPDCEGGFYIPENWRAHCSWKYLRQNFPDKYKAHLEIHNDNLIPPDQWLKICPDCDSPCPVDGSGSIDVMSTYCPDCNDARKNGCKEITFINDGLIMNWKERCNWMFYMEHFPLKYCLHLQDYQLEQHSYI